jgi:hypothetical protein
MFSRRTAEGTPGSDPSDCRALRKQCLVSDFRYQKKV